MEANLAGRTDMQKLFAEHNISNNKYDIFPCRIEDYHTDKKYDIIIAEGFLPYIYNQEEVINKLQELVAESGIIVISCNDDVCMFVEIMKRLVGMVLTHNLTEYEKKVEYLEMLFAPQLSKLRGVSRSPRDWVQDQILNPAAINGMELTMSQAIDYFREKFDVLGCSPRMFTDYSWYKDIWFDYKENYKEQFSRKRLSLLMANTPEIILSVEQADIIVKHFEKIRKLESEYERTLDTTKIGDIVEEMNLIENFLRQDFCAGFVSVFHEIKQILSCILKDENINMDNYPHFFSAFGRTLQYISFVKG